MHLPSPQTVAEGGGQIASIARTFGIDWPHLIAQTISFGIVCVVLYVLAYKPILRMLEARREQIASGLANAEKIEAELARIDAERLAVLPAADAEGQRLIEEARAAAARVGAEETQKAVAAAERVLARAHEAAERDRALAARRGAARDRTAGRPDDGGGDGKDPDRRGSAAAGEETASQLAV